MTEEDTVDGPTGDYVRVHLTAESGRRTHLSRLLTSISIVAISLILLVLYEFGSVAYIEVTNAMKEIMNTKSLCSQASIRSRMRPELCIESDKIPTPDLSLELYAKLKEVYYKNTNILNALLVSLLALLIN
jgi:hypothetical protein